MPDISVIYVNYNVKYYLENSIISLLKYHPDIKFQIIVIDNSSSDGSEEYITKKFPYVTYVYNEKNVGFGKANNQAFHYVKAPYVLIINPDSLFIESCLKQLIEYLSHNKHVGGCGIKTVDSNLNLIKSCKRSFPTPFNTILYMSKMDKFFKIKNPYKFDSEIYKKSSNAEVLSGSFMFLKKELLIKGITFSKDYFMYAEDIELCKDIYQMRYKLAYLANFKIIHYSGKSSVQKKIKTTYFFYTTMGIYIRKHFKGIIIKYITMFCIYILLFFKLAIIHFKSYIYTYKGNEILIGISEKTIRYATQNKDKVLGFVALDESHLGLAYESFPVFGTVKNINDVLTIYGIKKIVHEKDLIARNLHIKNLASLNVSIKYL